MGSRWTELLQKRETIKMILCQRRIQVTNSAAKVQAEGTLHTGCAFTDPLSYLSLPLAALATINLHIATDHRFITGTLKDCTALWLRMTDALQNFQYTELHKHRY